MHHRALQGHLPIKGGSNITKQPTEVSGRNDAHLYPSRHKRAKERLNLALDKDAGTKHVKPS
jgi:hypothetical protein